MSENNFLIIVEKLKKTYCSVYQNGEIKQLITS